jgi:hypothetical protein
MIAKILRLSIAHITSEDRATLTSMATEERGTRRPFTVAEYDYGFFAFVPTQESLDKSDFLEELIAWGVSSAVARIMLFARSVGCDYVCIDSDENTVDELPTYDW